LDTDLKVILLDHQNNFVGTLKIMSNVAKTFDNLGAFYIIILIVQQNFFSYLCLAKILDLSAKLFFSCMQLLELLELNYNIIRIKITQIFIFLYKRN